MRLGIPGSIAIACAMPNCAGFTYSAGSASNNITATIEGGSGLVTVHMLQQVFEA